MSLPGFLSAINAVWFLLLVPLIIFYFLKLKRPRFDIPSLALWRQVISDQRVNSPFQKFKRNLLLLLQILLLCSLVMGAMQPYLSSGSSSTQNLPILIDNSASMAALDEPGGKSRLDLAKQKVNKLIDDLLPGQRLCLISVNSTARQLTDFTDNKRILKESLQRLEVVHVASRIEDGLRMAQAMSRVQPIEMVVLISDGNVPSAIEFELPYKLNFQKLDPGGANIGIVEFNARKSRLGWEVFARIEGTKRADDAPPRPAAADDGEKQEPRAEVSTSKSSKWNAGSGPPTAKSLCEYTLLQGGNVIKQETVSVEGGKPVRLVFPVATSIATSLELRIKPDEFDSLELDNVVYLDLPAPRSLAVYCPRSMETYRSALESIPDLELYPGSGVEPKIVDLKLSESTLSLGPDARVLFNVGFVPDDLSNLVELESGESEVVDWRRTSPLLQHVQLLDVQIADSPKLAPRIAERDFELAGYEIIAQSRTSPLILEKNSGNRLDYQLLFHTDRSSLVYRVGFPILVHNLTQIAAQRANLLDVKAIPTGIIPAQRITPDTEVSLTGPNGVRETNKSDADGLLIGLGAPYVGEYEISGISPAIRVGASLLSSTETSLNVAEKLVFNEEVKVEAATSILKSDQPLWRWFALAALAFLLVEWWYYQKRPAGVPI